MKGKEQENEEFEEDQFKYFRVGDSKLRELASEQLLKEIGVDIQKFLSPQPNERDPGIFKTPSPGFAGIGMGLNMPSLTQLTPPSMYKSTVTTTSGGVNPPKVLDMKYRQQMHYNKPIPTDDQQEQFLLNH